MSFTPTLEPLRPAARPLPPPLATYALIGICIVVAVVSKVGTSERVLEQLFITNYPASGADVRLPEIASGQFWRLLTPIFIHFSLPHIVFNLLAFRDLGTMFERADSVARLLLFTVITGVLSNLGQLYAGGPFFGGMSGVVYALLGYIWMRSRFSPGTGFVLHPQTVLFMLAWFVACYVGLIKGVANTAHGVGLAAGIVWGFTAAKARRPRGLRTVIS